MRDKHPWLFPMLLTVFASLTGFRPLEKSLSIHAQQWVFSVHYIDMTIEAVLHTCNLTKDPLIPKLMHSHT